MSAREQVPQRKVFVTIRCGRAKEAHETWRYYSIVNILRYYGATQKEAYEAAKWVQKAKLGERRELWPGITMEVTEREHAG